MTGKSAKEARDCMRARMSQREDCSAVPPPPKPAYREDSQSGAEAARRRMMARNSNPGGRP